MLSVFGAVMGLGGCSSQSELSSSLLKSASKDALVNVLCEIISTMEKSTTVLRSAACSINALQSDQIFKQKKIIQLQEESKGESIKVVAETVRSEMKSYSDVVKEGPMNSISPRKLEEAVKSAVNGEERGRSVVVFGLPEEEETRVKDSVTDLLNGVSRFTGDSVSGRTCFRLGRKRSGVIRPVRVCFSVQTSAEAVLRNARNLKQLERYKNVYICPDRTPTEREERRKLVAALKNKVKREPQQFHYLKNGTICSREHLPSYKTSETENVEVTTPAAASTVTINNPALVSAIQRTFENFEKSFDKSFEKLNSKRE